MVSTRPNPSQSKNINSERFPPFDFNISIKNNNGYEESIQTYIGEMVNVHRIRKAKRRYDKSGFHIFLEVEKNRWLEIESLDGVSYESIQSFLEKEKETGIRVVGFTDQNFQWGTIKEWEHAGIIKDLKLKTG
jgi:hypothetical protein